MERAVVVRGPARGRVRRCHCNECKVAQDPVKPTHDVLPNPEGAVCLEQIGTHPVQVRVYRRAEIELLPRRVALVDDEREARTKHPVGAKVARRRSVQVRVYRSRAARPPGHLTAVGYLPAVALTTHRRLKGEVARRERAWVE